MSTVTPAEADLPNIISVDDHVLEPRDLWQRELPASLRERGPHTVKERVRIEFAGGGMKLHRDDPDGHWCDLWLFDDLVLPTGTLHAAAGVPPEEQENLPAVYEDFRPGTYDRGARLVDMDENHVDVSICYPVGSSRVDLQACKLEYSIVSPK